MPRQEELLSLPVDELREMVERYGTKVVKREMLPAMERITALYEAEAVLLAPVASGHLEGSSTVRVKRRGAVINAILGFAASYAAWVHELPPHRRGPKTRAKAQTKFGPPGPKYLERVLRGMDFSFFLGKELEGIWKRLGRKG